MTAVAARTRPPGTRGRAAAGSAFPEEGEEEIDNDKWIPFLYFY
jgi:hypothetical protein